MLALSCIYLFIVDGECHDWRPHELSALRRVLGQFLGGVSGARTANLDWLGRQGLAYVRPGLVRGAPGVHLGDVSGARVQTWSGLDAKGWRPRGPGGVIGVPGVFLVGHSRLRAKDSDWLVCHE